MNEQLLLLYIGYFASGIIAFSMTMNSIVKFRWINLVGASTFALYGFMIGAFPVMVLNGFIVAVDIFYLRKIYSKRWDSEVLMPDYGTKNKVQYHTSPKMELSRLRI